MVLLSGGAFILGYALGSSDSAGETAASASSTTSTTEAAPTTSSSASTTSTTTTSTTTPAAYTPTPSDFEIELVLIGKECFGSAGGLVQVETDMAVSDAAQARAEGRWRVIYEIAPVEDGPEVQNTVVDFRDGTFERQTHNLATESCEDESLATVTGVREL